MSDPKRTKVEVKPPLDKLKRRLEQARERVSKLETPNAKASIYLDRWVQMNFRTEGKKVGGWEPFRFGGRLKKGQLDTSAKLLQDTGRLRASFVPFWSKTNAGIGSDLPYSKTHNEGIGHVPARRMLPYHNEVKADLKGIYNRHVETELRRLSNKIKQDRGGVT